MPNALSPFPLRHAVALACLALPGLNPASAQGPDAAPPSAEPLAEITNTATRTERRADNVPATVTVRRADEAADRGARDLKDALRDEPDLALRLGAARFTLAGDATGRAGGEGLNVRGLEGNQVMLLVDGVRVPQSFTFGTFATGRTDYLALDTTATVEVLRGPASTQFGSDGLAGVVALRTLEPTDLLKDGQAFAGRVRLGASTLDDAGAASVAVARRQGDWQTLFVAGVRQGHETGNQGRDASEDTRRTAPNPIDYTQASLLAKARVALGGGWSAGATFDHVQRRTRTEALSARTVPAATPAATAVLDLDADDRLRRTRVAAEAAWDDANAPLVQQAEAHLYVQDARNRQFAAEDRYSAADRTRDNRYRERTVGASAQAQANLAGTVAQRISAGVDLSESAIEALRDGTTPPAGESFPTKPFPDTRYRLLGAWLQDEVEAGAFSVIPALRFDRFELRPAADGYSGVAVPLQDQALTPRLGVVWRAHAALQPYAQWARGFRAPTPMQVNNAFANTVGNYTSIGNPDLKAEHAESVELGLRGSAGAWRWQLAAYDNRYRDFISQRQVSGSFTAADPAVFQYVNLNEARIHGVDARVAWAPAAGWQLRAAWATARGDSETAGVRTPLNTVGPARATFGVQQETGRFAWRAQVEHARAKSADRLEQATQFAPPAYTVLDLGASWRFDRATTLVLALDNATDKTYWRWSDMRGVAASSPVLDAYTAPGRSVSATLRHEF